MEVPIFVQVMRIVIITSYPTPHRYMQIHILTYHVLSVDPGSICKINNSKSISEMVLTALFNYTIWFPSSVGCIRQCWLLRCIVICWKVCACRMIKFILCTSVLERQKETKWSWIQSPPTYTKLKAMLNFKSCKWNASLLVGLLNKRSIWVLPSNEEKT